MKKNIFTVDKSFFLLHLLRKVKQHVDENTQELVKGFYQEIQKTEEGVSLQVVHRSRKRRDGRPRSIIAKCEHMKDRDRVLDTSLYMRAIK